MEIVALPHEVASSLLEFIFFFKVIQNSAAPILVLQYFSVVPISSPPTVMVPKLGQGIHREPSFQIKYPVKETEYYCLIKHCWVDYIYLLHSLT